MNTVIIGHQPCIIHVSGTPTVALLQLTARHEQKTIDREIKLIEQSASTGFIFVGVYVDQWAEALMPWADEAVSHNPETGHHAEETLNTITTEVLPYIYNTYNQLPCIIGGYSLGGLFALWAATQSNAFTAVAAASPSVWINNWNTFAESNSILTQYIYLSLGDREEKARNQRMAAVGPCIRRYYETLKTKIGQERTTLRWHIGGHFDNEDQRMADAYNWCIKKLYTDEMVEK